MKSQFSPSLPNIKSVSSHARSRDCVNRVERGLFLPAKKMGSLFMRTCVMQMRGRGAFFCQRRARYMCFWPCNNCKYRKSLLEETNI